MSTHHAAPRWGARSALALLLLSIVAALAPAPAATANTTGPGGDGEAATATTGGYDPEQHAPRVADRRDAAPAGPDGRIVGGSTAPAGAYPSQAALVLRGYSNHQGQICGGTVIERSWILTAAHCVRDPASDWYLTPADLDVLVGTQDLTSGGTRIRAVELRIHPGWDRARLRNDIALIRLDRPVPDGTPLQQIAPSGAPPAAGTLETAVGWGDMAHQGQQYPTQLRHVDLHAQDNRDCRDYFGPIYDATAHICAWASGKGTCQGDSGGPVYAGGIQVGVVSWGAYCGSDPSVFARVSTYSTWIRWQVRYGPLPDANAFVRRQYLDLFGRQPSNIELFYGVAGLQDGQTPAAFVTSLLQGTLYQARAGGVTRLYRAVFLRPPDSAGMTFWMAEINRGVSLRRIADLMVRAREFGQRYGALDSAGFVDLVYENVLGRPASEDDQQYWERELETGARTRGQVMVGFSESPEHKAAQGSRVKVITAFHGLVRRVPGLTETGRWSGESTGAIASFLLGSYSYAARF